MLISNVDTVTRQEESSEEASPSFILTLLRGRQGIAFPLSEERERLEESQKSAAYLRPCLPLSPPSSYTAGSARDERGTHPRD
ncbi:unnamed protein product [Lota lota]